MSCACMNLNNLEITIIQGDTYQASLKLTRSGTVLTDQDISHVYLTCGNLTLQKEFIYNSLTQKFYLNMTGAETAVLRNGSFKFDITIFFVDNAIITTRVYNGALYINKKDNPIIINSGV